MNLRRPFVLVTALALAACSPRPETQTAEAASSAATMSRGPQAASSTLPAVAPRFARLPDRGSLVVYPVEPVVRLDGAYTWHQAGISEAHARRAIDTGHLQLTTPSGEHLDFRYERHVEHPNGDWTWIGSMNGDDAQEAIITFGEKAAFGSISQPGKEPLRLTIRNGASWLIETDPRKIAGINSVGTRPTEPDFIVAPDVAGKVVDRKAQAAGAVMTGSAATGTAAAGATPATTVDVALGYTPGFVSYYGGDSQAVTRLNNMVDITNEAYVNSQIDARIRLVRTVLVNYTDSNSNDTALEELTGFVAPSTRTTPAAAFSELRSARDAYGADLVSLVRRYNTPENEGCGIAWLIGGGRSGIDSSDAFFGYSVVSDGRDADVDGKTYFCRDETLAHELGHNMGSAHDRDASDGDDNVLQSDEYGVFDYSFGYKSTSTGGNFYTIMAYGDSGQTRYRLFSNPRITTCGGFACGIDNQADNARSISQTIGTVAAFRATVVPTQARRVPVDVNADGRTDLLWRRNGEVATWYMDGLSVLSSAYLGSSPGVFRVVAAGDYNGDGYVDLAWSNGNQLVFWMNQGSGSYSASAATFYGSDWQPFASMDVDNDGKADLLWRSGSNIAQWLMNGSEVKSTGYTGDAGIGFKVIAAGDFNGDGAADLALANPNQLKIWINSGSGSFTQAASSYFGGGWVPYSTADVTGDGNSDLLWKSGSAIAYWAMNGATTTASGYLGDAGAGFQLVASGDYNGDARGDLIFSNGNQMITWINGGNLSFSSSSRYYGDGWQPFDPTLPDY